MSKDEELFSIRLPDGTYRHWTIAEVMAYQSDWKVTVCQEQEQMMDGKNLSENISPAAMDTLIDTLREQVQRETIRQMVREELKRMLPEITEQVSAGLTKAIRMRGARST